MIETFASIRTRYARPTNTKGSQVIVTDRHPRAWSERTRRRITVSWDDSLNTSENHYKAAVAWLAKHNPDSEIVGSGLAFDGDYYWTWEG